MCSKNSPRGMWQTTTGSRSRRRASDRFSRGFCYLCSSLVKRYAGRGRSSIFTIRAPFSFGDLPKCVYHFCKRPVGVLRRLIACTYITVPRNITDKARNETHIESLNRIKHCGPSTLNYLSTWDRTILRKDHSRCANSLSCQANQTNTKTYTTQHTADCMGCREHGLPSEIICSYLNPDKITIPLVTFGHRSDSPLEFFAADISQLEALPLYVAISHVWSDGKGNPHRNFLPSCQLLHIQERINALYPSEQHPVPFWMDPLCVPVGKRFWPIRNRALNRMKDTYKLAHKVLVLDRSLEIVDSSVAPEEALLRIHYSPWSTRLWTMQECRLGNDVYFQFRDRSISFDNGPLRSGAYGTLAAVQYVLHSMSDPEIVCFDSCHIHRSTIADRLQLIGRQSGGVTPSPCPSFHRSHHAATS